MQRRAGKQRKHQGGRSPVVSVPHEGRRPDTRAGPADRLLCPPSSQLPSWSLSGCTLAPDPSLLGTQQGQHFPAELGPLVAGTHGRRVSLLWRSRFVSLLCARQRKKSSNQHGQFPWRPVFTVVCHRDRAGPWRRGGRQVRGVVMGDLPCVSGSWVLLY